MANPFALWELVLYGIVTTIPYIIMSTIVFRNHTRFHKQKTLLIVILMTFCEVLPNISVYFISPAYYPLVDLTGGLVYLVFLFVLVKDPPGKLAFYLISLSNFSNLYVILGKYIESRISMEMALTRYNWTFSLCVLTVQIIMLPLMYKVLYQPLEKLDNRPENRHMWHFLWLVPATFTLIWMSMFYDSERTALERMTSGCSYLLYKALVDAGSILIYELIIALVRRSNENLDLMEKTLSQKIELSHYKALNEQIDAARKTRHDIRLQLRVLHDFANENDDKKVLAYIEELLNIPSLQNPIIICENAAANSVLQYYRQLAEDEKIRTQINFIMPEDCFIRPSDITTMLGNLLKNSIEACSREKPADPYIKIKGNPLSRTIYALMIENPSRIEPDSNEMGHYVSHNHEGSGLGLPSVQSIVDRYAGTLKIQHENGIFRVSIILYQQNEHNG